MIEITRAMLEEKVRQAKGEAPFVVDKICEALLAYDLSEWRKLPGVVQNYAGLYGAAKRRQESLKGVVPT
ncbi:MAG: hypothetical protein ACJ754_10945 [Pyrinomonadaceae bacterium]